MDERQIRQRLCEIEVERNELLKQLKAFEQVKSGAEKIKIFRDLFRGREDVYPIRWENKNRAGYSPACSNEWVRGVCQKPKIKCSNCPNKAFLKVTDDTIRQHLTGRKTLGIYPLLPNDLCWFLASDFDKDNWQKDVAAFMKTCKVKKVPAYVEKSRSGNGAHVWCARTSPVLSAGEIPVLARVKPAHQESSLGLMEVTT